MRLQRVDTGMPGCQVAGCPMGGAVAALAVTPTGEYLVGIPLQVVRDADGKLIYACERCAAKEG